MCATSAVSATAENMTEAAEFFLASLDPQQRAQATFVFDSDGRDNWHYTPRPREGLSRGEMNAAQLQTADALMASGLAEVGSRKAQEIIQLELVLARIEGSIRFDRNPDLYFFSVFGSPGGGEPWGWQVDGHHLSLNYTLVEDEIVSPTPLFFGAHPAEVKDGPEKGLRVLEAEEEIARELFLSLDGDLRARAVIFPDAPRDLITKADRRVEIGDRMGLPAGSMSAGQREKLMALVKTYVGRSSEDLSRDALRKIERDGVDAIYFGWAGGDDRWQGHYYRIHGPSLFVEYDNTQVGANHIHSVWRDVEGDFGRDELRDHYKRHHT